jgi:hypothetical protein
MSRSAHRCDAQRRVGHARPRGGAALGGRAAQGRARTSESPCGLLLGLQAGSACKPSRGPSARGAEASAGARTGLPARSLACSLCDWKEEKRISSVLVAHALQLIPHGRLEVVKQLLKRPAAE